MKLRYTPEARADIRRLHERIAGILGNPTAAERLIGEIIHACAKLKRFPLMGMELSGKTGRKTDLRFLVCEKQIIFYRVSGDHISVTRVIDGRSNYLQIIFGDDTAR